MKDARESLSAMSGAWDERGPGFASALLSAAQCVSPASAYLAEIESEQKEDEPFEIFTAGQLLHDYPELRKPVIEGLLREGETMNVIATTKVGKSWLAVDLALAIASGRRWLGREVAQGEVLIIDNELHCETISSRIRAVSESRGIPFPEYETQLQAVSLRGRLESLSRLASKFYHLETGRYKVIILDALYRFAEEDADENSNADATAMYNLLDLYASKLKCAFVLVHHSTKGNQSGKGITDVGAGAGAQSRAADTHVAIRAHEEENCAVVDAAARSWRRPESICVRWEYPVWNIAEDLDPKKLAGAVGGKTSETKDAKEPTLEDVLEIVREKQPIAHKKLIDLVQDKSRCSERKAIAAVRRAFNCDAILNTETARNKDAKYTLPEIPL